MILGKFLPPHLGHQYLIDFARHYVDDLTVLVGTLKREPIPGEIRFRWMKELFPTVNVVHHPDENPQEPHEHPDFWQIWRDSIRKYCPHVDLVFASETYGFKLAEVLGAQFVPVNINRSLVPVSGTCIRQDPMTYWEFLPPVVRPWFVRKICIVGPESVGKSTLTRQLAEHFRTVWVHEYARDLLDTQDNRCDFPDIERIARGHMASEEAMAKQANRLLFCDTDPMTTVFWSEFFFQSCPPWIRQEADQRHYDLHLLCAPDVPWVNDPQRFHPAPETREAFFRRCENDLIRLKRPFAIIQGSWDERFQAAITQVEAILGKPVPLAGKTPGRA